MTGGTAGPQDRPGQHADRHPHEPRPTAEQSRSAARDVLVLVDSDHADTPYDQWAAGTDLRLHLLVAADKHGQYGRVPGALAVADYAHGGAVEQAALAAADRLRLRAVLARAEGDVLRAARLRELAQVPGQHWSSAIAFRDKVLMKTLLREQGILVPQFAPIRVLADLFGFVRRHGYPVVVKPAYGSGSTGTQVLRGPVDLAELLRAPLPEHAEVECFVEGTMYVVDGLVAGGELVAAFASRYLNDCLSYRSGGYLGSVQLTADQELTGRLIGYARRVLAALPTPECTTFHLEVFHTPADELVICEVASRTGGALTTAAIRAAGGFDLDREWFLAQVGEPAGTAGTVTGCAAGRAAAWLVCYPEHGTLLALPGQPPGYVVEQRLRGELGRDYQGGEKSGRYLAGYVLTGPDTAEVERRAHELARWFAAGARWQQ
ncbi:acetyl-CoA carboxylase biotin carboxylase subunit family protein [Kitasatospora sp. NPDC008050]|uniref:ATP-grasp domain-containing protein n=1 Tax=Kitasatospora sp. NPDC008050 TaxID=3364021 RepID=UPI0036E3DA39